MLNSKCGVHSVAFALRGTKNEPCSMAKPITTFLDAKQSIRSAVNVLRNPEAVIGTMLQCLENDQIQRPLEDSQLALALVSLRCLSERVEPLSSMCQQMFPVFRQFNVTSQTPTQRGAPFQVRIMWTVNGLLVEVLRIPKLDYVRNALTCGKQVFSGKPKNISRQDDL